MIRQKMSVVPAPANENIQAIMPKSMDLDPGQFDRN